MFDNLFTIYLIFGIIVEGSLIIETYFKYQKLVEQQYELNKLKNARDFVSNVDDLNSHTGEESFGRIWQEDNNKAFFFDHTSVENFIHKANKIIEKQKQHVNKYGGICQPLFDTFNYEAVDE